MMKLKESLTTKRNGDLKNLIITYPSNTLSNTLKNQRFKVNCTSHSISEDKLRANSDIYTEDSIAFLLLYDNIDGVTAIRDSSLSMPDEDFKKNSVVVRYDGKNYEVKEEEKSAFEVGVWLYCINKD